MIATFLSVLSVVPRRYAPRLTSFLHPKIEDNRCGANYPAAHYPYPAAPAACRKQYRRVLDPPRLVCTQNALNATGNSTMPPKPPPPPSGPPRIRCGNELNPPPPGGLLPLQIWPGAPALCNAAWQRVVPGWPRFWASETISLQNLGTTGVCVCVFVCQPTPPCLNPPSPPPPLKWNSGDSPRLNA